MDEILAEWGGIRAHPRLCHRGNDALAASDAISIFPGSQFELSLEGDLGGKFENIRLHRLFTNLFVNAARHEAAAGLVRVHVVGD